MARLILDWLNEEVRLSKVVTSLDDDFRDGYLLGELLMRYNQQDDFGQFDTKDTPECHTRNFCLLEPTLRRLEVPFNFKLAYDIMDGKYGVMKALLSELKAVLDRIKKNSQPPIAPVGQNGQIMRVMNPGKAFYDKSMSASFEKSMRMMMENPTEALIKKAVTNRFVALGNELREQANFANSMAMDTLISEKQRQKEIFRHRKKHEGEFAKAWDLINVEQWKKNQMRATNRKELTVRLAANETMRAEQRRTAAMTSARETTFNSIDDFDQRLEREVFREDSEMTATLGSSLRKSVVGVPGTGVPELSYVDKANLQAGLVSALKKIKEHHDDGVMTQQSHDRRRRKFVREREFSQTSNLQNTVEADMIGQLLNPCESENVEHRAKDRILAQKQVIIHNRLNRNEIVKSIDQNSSERELVWVGREASREKDTVVKPRLESQFMRIDTLLEARSSAERQRSIDVATEVLNRILDLSGWVISCRHLGLFHVSAPPAAPQGDGEAETPSDVKCVPVPVWSDAVTMFASSLEMPKMLRLPSAINVYDDLPFRLCEQPQCLDQGELLKAPFQSHHVMVPASTTVLALEAPAVVALPSDDAQQEGDGVSTTETTVPPMMVAPVVVLSQEDALTAPGERVISEFLALNDANSFFSTVSGAEIAGFDAVPENVVPEEAAAEHFTTPSWLLAAPSKYLLGEAIVASRCVSDPIPEDGKPAFELPKMAFRGAICGVSDNSRKALSKVLAQKMPNVAVIKVESLVHEYTSLLAKGSGNEEEEEKRELASLLASFIDAGSAVPNSVYVSLLVQTIRTVPEDAGFVIEDFPNTREQASLLLEALSGINYEVKKPSPADRASSLAPHIPTSAATFDPAKCGLDKFIIIDSGDSATLTEERVRTRLNLQTGSMVLIKDETESVAFLQDLYTPLRPSQTFSLDVSICNTEASELYQFIQGLGLAERVKVSDFESLEEAVSSVTSEILTAFGPPSPLPATDLVPEGEEGGEASAASDPELVAEEGAVPSDEAPVVEESSSSNGEPEAPVIPLEVVEFPKQLADALTKMWQNSEDALLSSSRGFFCSLRDSRYQMLQRRRAIHDVIYSIIIQRDARQDLFETFRAGFNELMGDFRFDVDCVAELHLRAVELGDAIFTLSENRRREAEAQLQQFSDDGQLQIAIHRCHCEGAALLQSLLNCFSTGVHILFDVSKAVAKYDKTSRVCNLLEETLAVTIGEAPKGGAAKDAKGGKDSKGGGGKGGKDAPAAAVPFREPVPGILLPAEIMNTLPSANVESAETVDPKAKKPADKVRGAFLCPLPRPRLLIFSLCTPFHTQTHAINRERRKKHPRQQILSMRRRRPCSRQFRLGQKARLPSRESCTAKMRHSASRSKMPSGTRQNASS